MRLHDDLQFICETCGKSYAQKAYLQQHMQGTHLGGWRAVCGAVFKWPKKCISMKNCASLELKKNQKLSELRIKATGQGLDRKAQKKVNIKNEKKRK